MKKKQLFLYASITLVLCVCTFCAGYFLEPPEHMQKQGLTAAEQTEGAEPQLVDGIYTIFGAGDYAIYNNLQQMIDGPSYIAIGHFGRLECETWNMNRDLEDPTKESEDLYVEGYRFKFHVLQSLKGEIPQETITVNIPHEFEIKGEITNAETNNRGEIIKEATERDPYSFMVPYEHYTPPGPGFFYVLFLNYNEDFDLYFPAGVPYMATVSKEGTVRLRSELISPTQEEREQIEAARRAESRASDVMLMDPYAHWSDRGEVFFYSEGGQRIDYIRNGPLVEDYLGLMDLGDFLTALSQSPEKQEELRAAMDQVELLPVQWWELPH